MTHPFTPGASADTCYTVLPPGHVDSENPAVRWACGRPRLHLAHAIPFDRIHGFVPGSSRGEACGVVVTEPARVYDCGLMANAAVHDVETLRHLDGAPMFPAKLVDRALLPDGPLFPGPEVEGQPTWLARLEDLPSTYEFRYTATQSWKNGPAVSGDESRWVQMRRRLPVPGDSVDLIVPGDYSTMDDVQTRPVSFAEVVETVVYAMSPPAQRTGDSSTTMDVFVATAVWRLLTEGTTGA